LQLICPKCEAVVDVEDDGAPDRRRPVRCSSCNESWFTGAKTDLYALSFAKPSEIDPEVVRILKEEAAHEISARQKETAAAEEIATGASTEVEAELKETSLPKASATSSEDYSPVSRRQWIILAAFCIICVFIGFYTFAPEIVKVVPSSAKWVFSYVFWVNDMRELLLVVMDHLEAFITSLNLGGIVASIVDWLISSAQAVKDFMAGFWAQWVSGSPN
tara:strand:+ start:519 stop:1172 length:654 start_codon:yes stop_codon:yes gene_type:complete